MKRIEEAMKTSVLRILRAYARHKLRSINPSPDVTPILSAVKSTLDRRMTGPSYDYQSRIEQLRSELEISVEMIMQEDFGAGTNRSRNLASAASKCVTRTIGEVAKSSSMPLFWCQVLHNMVIATGSKRVLEMGTCLGISAAYLASALIQTGGRLFTLEGAPTFAERAKHNLQRLGLDNVDLRIGRFTGTLEVALREMNSVDFVFVDGHHAEEPTLTYFELILPYTSGETVIVFDDIRWSKGMSKAWKRICAHQRVRSTVDLGSMGVVTLGAGPSSHLSIRL